jgi:competence protein ComEC
VSVQTQGDVDTDPLTLRDAAPIDPGTGGAVTERATLDSNGTTIVESTSNSRDSGTDESSDSTSGEGLIINEINADADGDERENLNDEYVIFENSGDDALDLSGWTIEDDVGQSYTIPDGFTLDAGETVTLRTGSGENSEDELYWGSGSPIWNNDGDTVIVTTASGERALEEEY